MKRLTFLLLVLGIMNQAIADNGSSYEEQVKAQLLLAGMAIRGDGFKSSDYKLDTLRAGETAMFNFDLSSDKKYAVIAVCDKDCRDIDLVLYDENGNEVARDTKTDGMPILEAAPKWTGNFKLKVKMYQCSANPCHYGIALFNKSRGEVNNR